ncbi:MAG: DUF177 domain-containing protein [Chloroflexi bacterium]|nr:DUF177 domain-containing protein [Chloroflexota bacterium]
MIKQHPSRLRFNFGFFLEATLGTSRTYELDYPNIYLAEDVTLPLLKGKFLATRTGEGVYLSGQLHTEQKINCVRCLEKAAVPIIMPVDDLFYYPPPAPEGEYNLGEDGYVDLAPLIRELVVLGIPIQPICQDDCFGLCVECGRNLNKGECGCNREHIDPRLAILSEFLD